MESTLGEGRREGGRKEEGETISITIQEEAEHGEDALMPLATTSIWNIGINIYMVSVSQNLSFRVWGMFS